MVLICQCYNILFLLPQLIDKASKSNEMQMRNKVGSWDLDRKPTILNYFIILLKKHNEYRRTSDTFWHAWAKLTLIHRQTQSHKYSLLDIFA